MFSTLLLKPEYSTSRREAWVAKLLSGETKKGKSKLHNFYTGEMCCLGVECELQELPSVTIEDFVYYTSPKYQGEKSNAIHPDHYELGLHDEKGSFKIPKDKLEKFMHVNEIIHPNFTMETLTTLNDTTNATHAQIGKFIIEFQEYIFTKVTSMGEDG